MKIQHLTPVLYGTVSVRKGTDDQQLIKILCDSGTSSTIVSGEFVKKLRMKKREKNTWNTKGGNFTTSHTAKVQITLPELDSNKIVTWNCHADLTDGNSRYDMIIGRDLLSELKFILDFGNNKINCKEGPYKGCSTRMKNFDDVLKFSGFDKTHEIYESEPLQEATERMDGIQAAKYKKDDLEKVIQKCDTLKTDEQNRLHKLLKKYETLFDGTLGTWKTKPYEVELKDGAKPYHARPYPIAKINEKVFYDKIMRMCDIGILRQINESEWGAPTFCQSKKNGTIRVLSDFCELNKLIKRKPYPIPRIQDML